MAGPGSGACRRVTCPSAALHAFDNCEFGILRRHIWLLANKKRSTITRVPVPAR